MGTGFGIKVVRNTAPARLREVLAKSPLKESIGDLTAVLKTNDTRGAIQELVNGLHQLTPVARSMSQHMEDIGRHVKILATSPHAPPQAPLPPRLVIELLTASRSLQRILTTKTWPDDKNKASGNQPIEGLKICAAETANDALIADFNKLLEKAMNLHDGDAINALLAELSLFDFHVMSIAGTPVSAEPAQAK